MGELVGLPNVGTVLERNLNEIGIYTVKQLRETSACLHMLYRLLGAIDGIKDSYYPKGQSSI